MDKINKFISTLAIWYLSYIVSCVKLDLSHGYLKRDIKFFMQKKMIYVVFKTHFSLKLRVFRSGYQSFHLKFNVMHISCMDCNIFFNKMAHWNAWISIKKISFVKQYFCDFLLKFICVLYSSSFLFKNCNIFL